MKIKFLSQIRLCFGNRSQEPYLFWYKLLGFYPKNLALYNEAMTHKSAQLLDEHGKLVSNERLEFLGDSILGSIVAELLFEQYPDKNEGFLSNMRAKIVCRKSLNYLAKQFGFTQLIKQKNVAELAENIYGNALEALVGAIYLDAGYTACEQFVVRTFFDSKIIDLNKLVRKEKNSKSALLEWAQKRKKTVVFEFVEERLNSATNQHLFFYNVIIDGKQITRSSGSTKQQAQQNAAKTALNKIKG